MVRYSYLFGRTVTIFLICFGNGACGRTSIQVTGFLERSAHPDQASARSDGFSDVFSSKKITGKKRNKKLEKNDVSRVFSWIEGQVKPRKTTRTHETGRETHPGLPSDGVSCAHPHCIIDPDEISTKKLHRLSQVIINDLWYGIVVMIIYYHY